MARNDWVVLVTEPAREYLAHSELSRFGLEPYLPQRKRRWRANGGTVGLPRAYPLFPRYLLLPFRDLDRNIIGSCRGISRVKPVLQGEDGVLWRAPNTVIETLRAAEVEGQFDEILKVGDKVALKRPVLANIEAFIEKLEPRAVQLMVPLFGGARLRVNRDQITSNPG